MEDESLNAYQTMMVLRNMYQSYTQLIESQNKVYFFADEMNIKGYDIEKRVCSYNVIPVFTANCHPYHFRLIPHFKDLGKLTQSIEFLYVLNYSQRLEEQKQQDCPIWGKLNIDILKQQQTSSLGTDQNSNRSDGPRLKRIQKISLTTIEFDKNTLYFERYVDYETKEYLKKKYNEAEKNLSSKNQSITIKNKQLVFLYDNDRDCKLIKNLFVWRIADSNSYLVLFPSGLLLNLNSNPLTLNSKQQLNLKKDENIMDCAYRVSLDCKFQCIWVMDQKYQVWKCSSDHNANQATWSFTKIQGFTNYCQKSFFQPATNFDDYYLTNDLQKLKSIQILRMDHSPCIEYLQSFNGTATKMVMIVQPDIRISKKFLSQPFDGQLTNYVTSKMGMDEDQLQKHTKIRIYVIAKTQPVIMNIINYSTRHNTDDQQQTTPNQEEAGERRGESPFQFSTQQSNLASDDNEIMELIYMGKAVFMYNKETKTLTKRALNCNKESIDFQGTPKEVRQFMVRRKRHLEIIYTNGLEYWTEKVDKSEVKHPYYIQDIIMSPDNNILISYCSIPGNEAAFYAHKFMYDPEKDKFVNQIDSQKINKMNTKDKKNVNALNPKNLTINSQGEIVEIRAKLLNERIPIEDIRKHIKTKVKNKNLQISLPKCLFFKELLQQQNQLDRFMQSGDGRILMCGRILIYLNENMQEVDDVGCIVFERLHSLVKYRFLSLIKQQEREQLSKLVKKPITLLYIVKFEFEFPPVYSDEKTDIMYFIHHIDLIENTASTGTSIIKISTQSLHCAEIYQSKFKITHFSMKENKEEEGGHQNSMSSFVRLSPSQTYTGSNVTPLSGKMSRSDNASPLDVAQALNQNGLNDSSGPAKIFQTLLGNCNKSGQQTKQTTNQQATDFLKDLVDEEIEEAVSQKKSPSEAESEQCDNNLLSLVSQNKNQINIEILLDGSQGDISDLHKKNEWNEQENEEVRKLKLMKSKLLCYVSVKSKNDFLYSSEVGWISDNKLILTLDNSYYLMNLNHNSLSVTKNHIYFGKHQVNAGLFVTIVSSVESLQSALAEKKQKRSICLKKKMGSKFMTSQEKKDIQFEDTEVNEFKQNEKINGKILKASECIHKMEIASLSRYVFIKNVTMNNQQGMNRMILFFTPCEELEGASIFTKLSSNYNIIQPYVEQIDAQFIELINLRIRNVNYYLNNWQKQEISEIQSRSLGNQAGTTNENAVHMFQEDISGVSAIDNAFQKNSIFCIKLFVDSLLHHTDDGYFSNCFDQAVLLMIQRGMNVKELVNSKLLYPQIWQGYTFFSDIKTPVIVAYNKEVEDLEYEDPQKIFNANLDSKYAQKRDTNVLTKEHKELLKRREELNKLNKTNFDDYKENDDEFENNQEECEMKEQYEMQFNYIDLETIQGDKAISITKTLMESEDLYIFEQEAIQCIIDYKWETYAQKQIKRKFFLYMTFLVFFYWDLQTLNEYGENGIRIKNWLYWMRKIAGFSIEIYFLYYECYQIKTLKGEYLQDVWNYLEVSGILFYWSASMMDLVNEKVSDWCRIIYVLSLSFSVIKVLYLIRVFKNLSFMVKMIGQVLKDLRAFFILFLLFLFVTAQSFMVMKTDTSAYGRIPEIFAQLIQTLRMAYGDFSVIDPYVTFDYKYNMDLPNDDIGNFKHHYNIVVVSFVVFGIGSIFLFLMLMNFIIAVICDTYATVKEFAVAHDYKQRVELIYELEVLFKEVDFFDQLNFPNILIIRKRKTDNKESIENNEGLLKSIKQRLKNNEMESKDFFNENIVESKRQLSNQIHNIDNDLHGVNKDIQKVFDELLKIKGSIEHSLKHTHSDTAAPSQNSFKFGGLMNIKDQSNSGADGFNFQQLSMQPNQTEHKQHQNLPQGDQVKPKEDYQNYKKLENQIESINDDFTVLKDNLGGLHQKLEKHVEKMGKNFNGLSQNMDILTETQQRQDILINSLYQQRQHPQFAVSPQILQPGMAQNKDSIGSYVGGGLESQPPESQRSSFRTQLVEMSKQAKDFNQELGRNMESDQPQACEQQQAKKANQYITREMVFQQRGMTSTPYNKIYGQNQLPKKLRSKSTQGTGGLEVVHQQMGHLFGNLSRRNYPSPPQHDAGLGPNRMNYSMWKHKLRTSFQQKPGSQEKSTPRGQGEMSPQHQNEQALPREGSRSGDRSPTMSPVQQMQQIMHGQPMPKQTQNERVHAAQAQPTPKTKQNAKTSEDADKNDEHQKEQSRFF